MKKKELKIIAQQMANAERIIEMNNDPDMVRQAKQEIMELSGHIHSLEEMTIIDEMVQKILEKD